MAWAAIPLRTKRPTCFRPGDWTVLRPITRRWPCQGGLPAERLFRKDLPRAIRHLADIELDWLVRVAIQEAKRRGRPVPTDAVGPTKTDTAATPRERQTRQEKIGQAAALTPGQMNAVRAAFKAGVPPRRIGRQFGLSQEQVRKALSIPER